LKGKEVFRGKNSIPDHDWGIMKIVLKKSMLMPGKNIIEISLDQNVGKGWSP
jgi:hypothetical protein